MISNVQIVKGSNEDLDKYIVFYNYRAIRREYIGKKNLPKTVLNYINDENADVRYYIKANEI